MTFRSLLFAFLVAVAAWGQLPTAARIAAIEKLLTAEMSTHRIPGLSIAIGDRSGQLWTNGYGMADLENFVPAKASSVYRTASIAKPMTAVAAMQLVEQGKLDLDAPIQTYLTSFPAKPWPITVRHLLGHLGGVRAYKGASEMYNTRHYFAVADALSLFAQDALLQEPGTAYAYSTYGYVLAGRIVEIAAGESYLDYMRKHIFEIAGMTATQADDVYRLIPNRVRGYFRRQDGELVNCALLDTSGRIPGGGFSSTAGDLVRFALTFDSGKLLKPESMEAMTRPMSTRDGKSTGYGMGWGLFERAGRKYAVHSGGQSGVSTMLVYLPGQHLSFAILTNLEGHNLRTLSDNIADLLFE